MKYKVGKPIRWYKATWDGTLNPVVFAACGGFSREKKNFSNRRKLAVFLAKKNNFWLAFDFDDLARFGKYLVKLWSKNHQTFNHHKKNYFNSLALLKTGCKKIPKNLTNLSNEELIKLYSGLFDLYAEFIGWSTFCEAIIVHLQPFVDRALDKCLKNYPSKSCRALIISSWFSFLRRKELLELKISFKIARNKKLKEVFSKNTKNILNYLSKPSKNNQIILRYLKFLQNEYYWVRNNYARAQCLSLNYFIGEIQKMLKEYNFNSQKIKNGINKINESKLLRKSAYKKVRLNNEDKFYLNILDEIGFLHDTRKIIYIESIEYFDHLFKEISRRTNLKERTLKFLLPQELNRIFIIREQNKLKLTALKRYNQCAVIFQNGKIVIETNRQKLLKLKQWVIPSLKKSIELRGTSASIGPKIKGTCCIVLSASEVNKVKKRNILVTGSTAPDYLPAIMKAAAILTEKGGLTSHAAIISRELGIPCIVGISNLLNILKDGDLVEVDANKGIVKILKNT